MPTRILPLLAALLLGACASPLLADRPAQANAVLPTAAVHIQARPTSALGLFPTADPTVIDRPILDDLTATARALEPTPATVIATPLPRPVSESRPSAERHPPTRIVIRAIDLDRQLMAVGLDERRSPIVPKHDPGWFTGSAAPGQGDNVVLWGHALRFRNSPDVPAPFGRLNELKPGASITLFDDSGAEHDYTITRQVWATPDQVDYILPKGREQLTMVSCIGKQVIATNGAVITMSHRLITIAEPANEQTALPGQGKSS